MLAVLAPALGAQTTSDSLRVYYVGRPVGWEHYTLTRTSKDAQLTADWSYVDRGRRIRTTAAAEFAADYSPRTLKVERISDTTRTPALDVTVDGKRATIVRNGTSAAVDLPPVAFAISQYTPVSQHLALLRYWKAHGSPSALAVFPGDPLNPVKIRQQGADELTVAGRRVQLTRYSIDGVVWGIEYAWLDSEGRLAMFTSAAGGLSTKTVRAELVPEYDDLMRIATRAAMHDLEAISSAATPLGISGRAGIHDLTDAAAVKGAARGKVALVGATLVDGTGGAPIPDATVIVADGLIVAAGPSATTRVPLDAKSFDVRGKTIVPGLWDMHAHLHQIEWLPAYIAGGVTSVRDMGNELPFIVALKSEVDSGRVNGPHIHMAGLVDGDGPNAFGAFSATTPAEGRAIVQKYHALGFEQMKLYDLLAPGVVSAICDEAHNVGMSVTGHLPRSLSITAAVDSGMDQFAHLPIRGDAQSDSTKAIIAFLHAHGTVIDPTESWNEIGGHSRQESVQVFQPVLQHLPPPFVQFRVANWGSTTIDTATAHARLQRSLATIRALHDAGVPIVAGTDEGIPGFSVYREMELYVMAGFSPMDALRSATAVPATVLHLEKEVGTIEAGKHADLLVLDKNPLDDISNIRTSRYVMHDGRLYETAALWKVAGFAP
ncbi:MAG: amidohydrolase family protein [Gemmatimonadales bacterium]